MFLSLHVVDMSATEEKLDAACNQILQIVGYLLLNNHLVKADKAPPAGLSLGSFVWVQSTGQMYIFLSHLFPELALAVSSFSGFSSKLPGHRLSFTS